MVSKTPVMKPLQGTSDLLLHMIKLCPWLRLYDEENIRIELGKQRI
jgi:hypothetical protein